MFGDFRDLPTNKLLTKEDVMRCYNFFENKYREELNGQNPATTMIVRTVAQKNDRIVESVWYSDFRDSYNFRKNPESV